MITLLTRRDLIGRAQKLPLKEIEMEHIARTAKIHEYSSLVVVFDTPVGEFKVLKSAVTMPQGSLAYNSLLSPLQTLIKLNLEREI